VLADGEAAGVGVEAREEALHLPRLVHEREPAGGRAAVLVLDAELEDALRAGAGGEVGDRLRGEASGGGCEHQGEGEGAGHRGLLVLPGS